jgi:hypothetical protein
VDLSALTDSGPVPAVNPADLRSVWELVQETRARFVGTGKSDLGDPDPTIGIGVELLVQVCNPEANVPAVWARSVLLGVLVQQGLLTSWQRGAQLDEAVFKVAAVFPIIALDQFDANAFVEQLRDTR